MNDPDFVLGRLSDPASSPDTQEEINAESLYLYDQDKLIRAIELRVSKYTLDFYLENLIEAPREYWLLLLRKIINVYNLNTLKLHLSEGFDSNIELQDEIIKLVYFLKVDLPLFLFDKKIKDTISFDEFRKLISTHEEFPYLFKWSILYIDLESYNLFIKQAVSESKELTYSDEV